MSEAVFIPTGPVLDGYVSMRSLSRRGIKTIVGSEVDGIPHFSSRYCSEKVQLPPPKEDLIAYKDALLSIAARPEVKTIIPVREYEAYLLAKYLDEFENHVSLVVPNIDTLMKGNDRLRLAKKAAESGVPVADTRLLSDVDQWNSDVVIKSRYNLLTRDDADSELEEEVTQPREVLFVRAGERPDIAKIRTDMHHDPIVQEYVPEADKQLYCALWIDGEPVATYQGKQLRKDSWVGGGGVYRESTYSPAVDEVAYELLSHLDWHGFACIEYIKDKNTGDWKFLEINPRSWQSLPQAFRADADFPYYYWLCAHGETEQIESSYNIGVASHSVHGEINHLLSVFRDNSPFGERPSFARKLCEIGTSCVTNPRFDYIHRDDPMMFIAALRYLMTKETDSEGRKWKN